MSKGGPFRVVGLKSTLICRYSYGLLSPRPQQDLCDAACTPLNIYPCYSFRFVWVTSEGLDSGEPTYARVLDSSHDPWIT